MEIRRRGVGVMAAIAIAVGSAGLMVTGCGLDVPNQVQPVDDTGPPDNKENVVPVDLDRSGVQLEGPGTSTGR